MRISDWSSDVCSSDLLCRRRTGDREIDRRANFFPRRAFAAPPIGQPRPAPYIEAMESTRPKLVIRNSETRDAAAIARLTAKVYGRAEAYSAAQIRGQINNFPEGQFLAEYEGQVVGFCATLIVPEAVALTDHR